MVLLLIPQLFITLLITSIISFNLYLGYNWYKGNITGNIYPFFIFLSILFLIYGKYLIIQLIGLFRKQEREINPLILENSQTFKVSDGSSIYIERSNSNSDTTIILIHGLGVDNNMWHYFKKYFRQLHNLIAMDIRGHGKSTKTRNNFSLERITNDLDELIENTEGKLILVGHSIGGMVLLTYCRLFKNKLNAKIQKIVLVHTTYTDATKTNKFSNILSFIKKPILVPLNYLIIYTSPLTRFMNWLSYRSGLVYFATMLLGFGGNESTSQIDFVSKYIYKTNPKVNAYGNNEIFKFDAQDILSNISVPVLVVTGEKDILTQKTAGEYIKDKLPNGHLFELKDANHAGFFEYNEVFNQEVERFIEGKY